MGTWSAEARITSEQVGFSRPSRAAALAAGRRGTQNSLPRSRRRRRPSAPSVSITHRRFRRRLKPRRGACNDPCASWIGAWSIEDRTPSEQVGFSRQSRAAASAARRRGARDSFPEVAAGDANDRCARGFRSSTAPPTRATTGPFGPRTPPYGIPPACSIVPRIRIDPAHFVRQLPHSFRHRRVRSARGRVRSGPDRVRSGRDRARSAIVRIRMRAARSVCRDHRSIPAVHRSVRRPPDPFARHRARSGSSPVRYACAPFLSARSTLRSATASSVFGHPPSRHHRPGRFGPVPIRRRRPLIATRPSPVEYDTASVRSIRDRVAPGLDRVRSTSHRVARSS